MRGHETTNATRSGGLPTAGDGGEGATFFERGRRAHGRGGRGASEASVAGLNDCERRRPSPQFHRFFPRFSCSPNYLEGIFRVFPGNFTGVKFCALTANATVICGTNKTLPLEGNQGKIVATLMG